MHERIAGAGRRVLPRWGGILAFCLLPAALMAAGGRAAAQGDTGLPTVLLVPERTQSSSLQQNDLIVGIKTTLRDALTRSARYQVHTFIPGENVIKRALNEHLIAADDLAEPYKPEGLQRIARAIGARLILKFATTLDKVEAHTEMKFLDNATRSEWVALADERINVPLVIKKRRLKPDDIVNLTVDSITARIGIPTNLAGKLKITAADRIIGGPKPGKERTARAAKPEPKSDESAAPTPAAPTPGIAAPGEMGTPDSRGIATAPAPTVRQKDRSAKAARGTGTPKRGSAPPTPDPVRPDVTRPPVFTNEADPSHDVLPAHPAVAPPPTIPRPDYEAQALRYRQTGDLSGAVQALRKAVNERPHDVGLRRQLIQAYQARQIPEAAHAEALRALRLDASNAGLYRLYGEVLMAEGDLPGAMQAFRDGIRIDPGDIACQVALGDALISDNHYVQALEAYSAASKSDAKSPLPHRRIARALAARAATDSDQYQASLAEIRRAIELTPATDTTSYVDDYVAIMHIVENRIREMLDELQAANQARVQAKRTPTELQRQIADMKLSSAALADYLEKVPPAAGHEVTQAHFTQANALLAQAIGFFKDLVEKGEDRFAESLKSGQVQAQRELTIAGQRLTGTRTADKGRSS